MLEQHDALIRLAAFVDGSDAHGGRIGQARVAGLFQPTLEQLERIGGQIVAAQAASGIFTAQVRNIKLILFNHLGYRPTEKSVVTFCACGARNSIAPTPPLTVTPSTRSRS